MRAVIYKGPGKISVEEVPDPQVQKPNDAVVRMTSSAICGSDLHMYDGHTSAKPGMILGHEPLGVVEEVGEGVSLIKEGDRVVAPFNVACGTCYNCIRGYSSACLTMNPSTAGAAYGYAEMGPYPGAQAELLKVPYADWALMKLPGKAGDAKEDDFVMLADVFPTAFHATELAKVSTGKTVAVFGAGPVGLLSAYCSVMKGASEVYIVDKSEKRLKMAESIGAIPINFTEGNPVKQIMEMRQQTAVARDGLHPEEKLTGVECGIDAVGYQAYDRTKPSKYNPGQVLTDLAQLINPAGHLGVIGVYVDKDPRGNNEQERSGMLNIPFGMMWMKGITIGMGQAPVKNYHAQLRDVIITDKAKPSFIISDRVGIDEAADAYKGFDKRGDLTKSVIKFD